MVYPEIIEGMYVRLRAAEESDAEVTLKMRLNKEKTKFLHPVDDDLEKQRLWIRNQRAKEGDYFFVVEDSKTHNPIGIIGLSEIKGKRGHPGRILMYGNAFQNFEAYYLILKFGFEILDLETQWGDTDIENKSAYQLCLKFGIQYKEPVYDPDMDRQVSYFDYSSDDFKANKPRIKKMIYRQREF